MGPTAHALFAVAEDAEPTSAEALVRMLQESAWPADPLPQRRFHPVLRRSAKKDSAAPLVRVCRHVLETVDVLLYSVAAERALSDSGRDRRERRRLAQITDLAAASLRSRVVRETVAVLAADARSLQQDLLAVAEATAAEGLCEDVQYWGASRAGKPRDPEDWAARGFGLPPSEAWRESLARAAKRRDRPPARRSKASSGRYKRAEPAAAAAASAEPSPPPAAPPAQREKRAAKRSDSGDRPRGSSRGRGGGGGRRD